MVAIVSGNSLGLELSSLSTLGSKGAFGLPGQGGSGEQVFVNAATGNLVVQRRDDFLASRGGDTDVVRTYNSLGQLNSNWSTGASLQRVERFGPVNAAGSTVVRTGRDGSQATYTWDAGRSCYITREGDGAHDTITYNGTGYERVDGSTGLKESYSGAGKLTDITDADGNASTYEYNGAGLLSKVVDSSGETVWYDYDTSQPPKLIGIRTEFKDSAGATVSRSTVRYSYDASSRLASVTIDLTPADGSITDGKVYTTSYTYDGASNRIYTLTQSDGSSLTFTYDAGGRVLTITDALGSVTSFTYDTAARRTGVVDPLNQQWLYDYDAAGRLITAIAPATSTTSAIQTFGYDGEGNVVAITNGDGETVTMAYDANGNQVKVVDALGNTVARTYSQSTNRLLTETTSTLATPVMVDPSGVSVLGDGAIVKTGGVNAAWDSGFRSSGGLTGGASVGFKPAQTNKAFMVGLTTDPGASSSYTTIDYALDCTSSGYLYVYENGGTGISLGSSYVAGDSLRVTYDGTNVTYLKNGQVLRTVAATIASPLYADSSFFHSGAKLTELSFGATATSVAIPLVAEINATVTPGGTVSKTTGTHDTWDASVRGLQGSTGGAMVSFKPSQTDKYLMVGLTADPGTNDSYSSIDYALYCTKEGLLYAYENGTRVDISTPAPSYAVGDTLQVVYDGSAIKYIKNGVTLLQKPVSITAPLFLDSSFATADANITELQFGKSTSTLATVLAAARNSGVAIVGDTITKVGGTNGVWDSTARSSIGYTGQANLVFSPAQATKNFMIGLNRDPATSFSWSKLDWAFFCTSGGALEIREAGSGNVLTTPTTYAAGDTLQITYDGAKIRYLKNGTVLREVASVVTEPLYMDSSFYSVGAKVTGVRFGDRAMADQTTRHVYAAAKPRQLRFTITPEGRVTQYLYDSYGQRTSEITYPADSYGGPANPVEDDLSTWVTTLGDLSDTVRKDYIYDARGLVTAVRAYTETNANGTGSYFRQTQYIYDQGGRLLQTIGLENLSTYDEGGVPATTYTYDGLGRVLTVSDARGAITSTTYTDSAQEVVVTYQGGATATSFYDKAGRLLSVARSGAGSTTHAYDKAGRLLMTTDPTGVRSFRLYDETGRLVGTVDGNGSLTEYVYDKADRVTSTLKYGTAVSSGLLYGGSPAGPLNPNLAAIRPAGSDATDVRHSSVYDDAGRLAYEIDDLGLVTQYEYDGAGRVVRTTRYAKGIGYSSGYTLSSVRAHLESDAAQAAAAENRVTRNFYGADGFLSGNLDAEGHLTLYTYDHAGRKVETRRSAVAVATELREGGTLQRVKPVDASSDQIETWYYDAMNREVGHVDAEGFVTRTTYSMRGQRNSETRYAHALAARPSWSTQFSDVLETVTSNADNDRKSYWYYAKDDKLIKSIDFQGTSTIYEYDTRGLLVKTTVGEGLSDSRISQARYDAWGRKSAELSAEGSAMITTGMSQTGIDGVWASEGVDLTYDDADRLTSRTDANGNKTLYFYDADGRLTHTVNARGEVEEQQYNALGQRTALVRYGTAISLTGLSGGLVNSTLTAAIAAIADGSKDSKIAYGYTGDGLLQRVTDPMGAQTVTNYNVFGEAVERLVPWQGGASINTDPRQDLFVYDRRGLLTLSTSDAAGVAAKVATRYDAFGRVIETTENDKVSKQFYDRLGRVVKTTDKLNMSRYTTFDAFGQVLTTQDELGKTTTYAYDRANRSVTMTTPEGVKVTTVQTRYGQTYRVTNGRGVATVYSYDRNGNLTETETGGLIIETRDYDRADRLLTTIDVGHIRTTYTYDAANRVLTRTLDPTDADAGVELNLVTTWTYDAKGQAITMKDARNTVTSYVFDLAGRKVKQTVDPTGLALTTQWAYDAQGHVLTVTDPRNVKTDYVFDELGRRISETVDSATGGLRLQRLYSYDAKGNVLTSRDPRGQVTRYRYDSEGRLTYTADPTGAVTLNTYDAKGQLVKQTRYVDLVAYTEEPSAVVPNANDRVTRYAYDGDGRLKYTVDAIGAVTGNEYDANGNLVKITRYADTITATELPTAVVAGSLDQVTRFEYDSLDREVRRADAMGSVTRSEYDLGGHLVRRTRYANTVAATSSLSSVVADSARDQVERFVYDAAGRETWRSDATGAVTRTEYDKNSNVTAVTGYATPAPGVSPDTVVPNSSADRVVSYFYDQANRVTYTVDALGYVSLNSYDANGNITSKRLFANLPDSRSTPGHVAADDTEDRVQTYFYDGANRVTYAVDALGYVSLNSYDANGNVTKTRRFADLPTSRATPQSAVVDDAKDRVQTFAYDNANRLLKSTDALEQSEEFTYDSFGNKLTYKNKKLAVWTYAYDNAGRLLRETSPAVSLYTVTRNTTTGGLDLSASASATVVTALTYDSFGNLKTRTEADGRPEERTTTYDYDRLNRQVKVTYPSVSIHTENSAELAANTRLGEATRDEAVVTPVVSTWYDAFGNAVASVDRVGAISYKTYDAAGRVKYEIDALGYITQYVRNAFGEATTQRRYANASSLAVTAPTSSKPAPSGAEVDAVIAAAGFTSASDRAMSTLYDKNGRVNLVMEPTAYVYNSLTNVGQSYGARIHTIYNAFGEPVSVGQLYDYNGANLYQYSHHYYDLAGRKVATADPLGNLTTYAYDSEGNLTKQVEFSAAMAANSWNVDGYVAPTANAALDRTTTWSYDKLNRKIAETKAAVTYYMSSTSTTVATSNSNLTTGFGYDAVGNLTWTQDAAGGVTRTYYDALGRISAVVAPSRTSTVDGSPFIPVVEFRRDAHSNVLAKIERASSATGVTATSYVATSSSSDRVTKTLYDSSGNARQETDAAGYQHYSAYTAAGRIAKNWQTVTDLDGVATTIYVGYGYDRLGRLIFTSTPSPSAGARVSTDYKYNAFGELIARGKNAAWEEYFEYDNAGRMWKTNSDGGDAAVYLYDLLGRRTAEISGAGSGRSAANDVSAATSASQAAAWTSVRRVNTKYNKLGHVIERAEAERQTKQGGITARTATASASITGSATASLVLGGGWTSSMKWSGTNKVQLAWATLAYLGSGDVRVDLNYDSGDSRTYDQWGDVSAGSAPVGLMESQVFAGNLANTGLTLQWTNDQSSAGGISAVKRLRVYKRDVNGEWFKVVDRGPDGTRTFADNGTQVEIGSPVDPATAVTFSYKKVGTATWTVVSSTGLTKFGDSHWFDASSLSGTYDYQVKLTEKDGIGETTESGTFTAETNDTDDDDKSEVWDRPVMVYTRDRWGNALKQSDPRNKSWLTVFTYNRDNQITSEKRPDPSNGDQNANSPTRTIYYDKLGRQAAILDERGYVNAQEWDAGGNLVEETHADGGRITYFYDAFGQKVRSVDAVGNKAAAGSASYLDHTTVHEYDRLGRLLSTTHGANSIGAVFTWIINTTTWELAPTRRNVKESFTYDEAGRKLTQVNGLGQATRYWYDRANNLVKTKLPGLQTTTATFDIHGHKTSERDHNGSVATWDYDYFGRLEGHTDIGGATYTYTYDTAGQLKTQTNTRGQNLTYYYDAAGQLVQVTDAGTGQPSQTTTTAYDLAGRHLREKVVKGGTVYQDNHLSYDTLGRLVDSADNRSHLTFSYDKANNRTQITTRAWVGAVGDDDVTTTKNSTKYFLYDSMNRQTVVDGVDAAGTINSLQGHKLTYDVNGNRISDTFWGNKVTTETRASYQWNFQTGQAEYTQLPNEYDTTLGEVKETYVYDAMDRLQLVDRDGFMLDQRLYDAAGRVVQSGPKDVPAGYASALNEDLPADEKIGFEIRRQLYDVNGWLQEQRTYENDGELKQKIVYSGTGRNSTPLGYDGVGNVKAYEVRNYDGSNYINTSVITLNKFESYAEAQTKTTSDTFEDGTSTSSYDANGYLIGINDATENTLDRTIVNDAAGRALRVTQNGNSLYTHIVNGEILGKYGVGVNEVDPRTSKGAARFAQVADFEFGYRYISGSYPSPTTGTYTVRQGDSLKSIAQAAWGDSSQWWRIAQANSLQGDRDLRVGQTLTMPSVIAGTSNNATTFKPYNPSDVIGDTSPNLPQPKGKEGCGPLAQIIMMVVAVVATVYTAGALTSAAGATFSQTMAAGASALSGGAAATGSIAAGWGLGSATGIAVGASSAAMGSIASQAFGMVSGAQDKFDWKGVALNAIGGGVTAGLGKAMPGSLASTAAARMAVANAMTQGIGLAVGAQDSFSWTAVAASAVGAGVSNAVAPAMGQTFGVDTAAGRFATRLATGLVTGTAVALMRGGRVAVQQVATDAFGNALASSLAEAASSPSQTQPSASAGGGGASGSWGDMEPVDYSLASDGSVGLGTGSVEPTAEPFVDSDNYDLMGTPREVGVVGKDGARGAWGIAQSLAGEGASNAEVNRIKNQLLALNPELADGVQKEQRYYVPDAGTPENLPLARSADRQYQVALAARSQPSSVAWGDGLSFSGDGTSFAELAALDDDSTMLSGRSPLSGMQRAQLMAPAALDAVAGAVESAGHSFGVFGTPESSAAWAVQTSKAAVEGIRSFLNDPPGAVAGWWGDLWSDDPAAVQRATTQGTGIALGVAGGVAMGRFGSVRSTGLGYDISRWGEYGLPSDGYFVRTLTREQYLDLHAGRSFSFGGKPAEGYPSGMGFIGSAEEVRGLTTVQGYREGLKLSYDPKYVLEFQLTDPAGLQNVIRAPYSEFVPGGKTGAGFSEWNYPGISSSDIVNGKVRVLK